jgi:hypothetical protein
VFTAAANFTPCLQKKRAAIQRPKFREENAPLAPGETGTYPVLPLRDIVVASAPPCALWVKSGHWPLHSITSSVMARSVGAERPRCVLRLISSNLIHGITGE